MEYHVHEWQTVQNPSLDQFRITYAQHENLASSPNVDARCADELAQNRLQLPDETRAAARGSGLHTRERDGYQPSADFG